MEAQEFSTESGIPDFRSENGLYQAQTQYGHSPEEMLSHSFFANHTETFYDYYKSNLLYPEVQPNKAHYALAKLEEQGKLKAVVTQNIDGLHQLAGSKKVFELHGSVLRNHCTRCHTFYCMEYILKPESSHSDEHPNSTIPRMREMRRNHQAGCGSVRRAAGSGGHGRCYRSDFKR